MQEPDKKNVEQIVYSLILALCKEKICLVDNSLNIYYF